MSVHELPDTIEWQSDFVPEWEEEDVYVEGGFGHCLVEYGGVKRYEFAPGHPAYDPACDLDSIDGEGP